MQRKPSRLAAVAVALPLLLGACGDTRIERTGSGAVAGGVAGGLTGFVCCGNPGHNAGQGAVIGAAIGALIGFLLDHPIIFDDGYRH
jgi:uncharacterized membrane protein